MMRTVTVGLLAATVMMGGGPARAAEKDIVETAVAAGSFTTLAKALTAADLVATLKGPGPFTVFAPTDEAFAKLPAGTIEKLLEPGNKTALQRVLTYQVVAGRVPASDVITMRSATTVSGGRVAIAVENGVVRVNDARVVTADVMASNGIIHVIDTVLLPEE